MIKKDKLQRYYSKKTSVRNEEEIKVPILRRIFVGSFSCHFGDIAHYALDEARENTDKMRCALANFMR